MGILDVRYTRDDMDDLDADPESDAADDAFAAAFKAALMDYMCRDLGVSWDRVEYHYYEAGHMTYVNEPSCCHGTHLS